MFRAKDISDSLPTSTTEFHSGVTSQLGVYSVLSASPNVPKLNSFSASISSVVIGSSTNAVMFSIWV